MQPDLGHPRSPLPADEPPLIDSPENPEAGIVLKSNWLMRLTRRKRIPCSSSTDSPPTPSSSASSAGGHSRQTQLLPKLNQSDFANNSRSRKHSIVYVFNKYLKLGSKQSFPINHQHNTHTTNHQSPQAAVETNSSSIVTSQDDPSVARTSSTSSSQFYNNRSSEEDQTLELWLNSLSVEDGTIYKAKIAMNPKGWYRGAMSRELAQKKLQGQPDGSFLVRDSQTAGCHFTLSFRSVGITLHYRIENMNGLWIIESCRFASMVGLIEHAQQLSHDQILCYVKPSSQLQQPFPVRLTSPISKFDEVPSLQHICRFVVRRHIDDASLTYLPPRLRDYVRQKPFLGREIGYFEA